jgi:hypothetical protein
MDKRLQRVEKHLGDGEPERGMIQFVDTTRWPADDQEHFRAGSPEQRAALIEAHTGRALPPPGRFVRLVMDIAPAPIDPAHAIAQAERILGAGSER